MRISDWSSDVCSSDLRRASGAAGRLSELLAESPEIAAPAHPVALPSPARGALAFEHVTFHYPTRPEIAALHDFSLAIAPGETVAVVGRFTIRAASPKPSSRLFVKFGFAGAGLSPPTDRKSVV